MGSWRLSSQGMGIRLWRNSRKIFRWRGILESNFIVICLFCLSWVFFGTDGSGGKIVISQWIWEFGDCQARVSHRSVDGSGGGRVRCRYGINCVILVHLRHVHWRKWLGVLFLPWWRDVGIRDNGGGGGSSGGGNGSGNNVSIWSGSIVYGNGLFGSVVASVIVHIVGFWF